MASQVDRRVAFLAAQNLNYCFYETSSQVFLKRPVLPIESTPCWHLRGKVVNPVVLFVANLGTPPSR